MKPIIWNGKHYKSIAEAARDLGVNYQTLAARIKKGYRCDDDFIAHSQAVIVDGTRYETMTEAAQVLGVTRQYISRALHYPHKYRLDVRVIN